MCKLIIVTLTLLLLCGFAGAQNTFCSANGPCTVTAPWTFTGATILRDPIADFRSGTSVLCSGSGDDTTGTQALINSLGGSSASLAPAKCMESHLTINNTLFTVRGAGRGKSQLQQPAASTGTGVDFNPSGSAGVFTEYTGLSDLDVFGVTGSSHGITATWVTAPSFNRIRVRNFGGDGLRTFQVPRLGCYDCEFRANVGNGASLGQQNDVALWANSSFSQDGGWGVNINFTGLGGDRSNSNTFLAPTFVQNTLGGMWVRGAATNGTSILGGYFEGNVGPDVKIGEAGVSPYAFSARGVYFHGTVNATAADIYAGTSVDLSDNFFEGYTGPVVNMRADTSMDFARNTWSTAGTLIQLSDGAAAPSPGAGGWARFIGPNSTDYTMQTPGGTNPLKKYINSARVVVAQFRADGSLQMGPSTVTPAVTASDINVARNDTKGLMMRVEQQGAGLSATPMFQLTATTTGYLGDMMDVQNKGTGSVGRFRNNTGTVFEVKSTGINADTLGFKHKRSVAGCATAASIGATCTTTFTWTTAFADANYTAMCTGEGITSGVPIQGGLTARVAASVTFQTVAATAAAAQFTNIICIAVHD